MFEKLAGLMLLQSAEDLLGRYLYHVEIYKTFKVTAHPV
jgi:hypothetical protein